MIAKGTGFPDRIFPAGGFIVTNLTWAARRLTHFYNQRGNAEQWIKEGKYGLNRTRLSRHRFAANEVRLRFFALPYNLGDFLRPLARPRSIGHRSLRTSQTRLIKIGAKVMWHSRSTCFRVADVSIPRNILAPILRRDRRLIQPVPV